MDLGIAGKSPWCVNVTSDAVKTLIGNLDQSNCARIFLTSSIAGLARQQSRQNNVTINSLLPRGLRNRAPAGPSAPGTALDQVMQQRCRGILAGRFGATQGVGTFGPSLHVPRRNAACPSEKP